MHFDFPVHYCMFGGCNYSVLLHDRMVHHACKGCLYKNRLLFMSVFNDCAVSDGYVYAFKNRKYAAFRKSGGDYRRISGLRAGLSVFMFTGFVKSIPLEIEEAAMIDGCNPLQTYFQVVLPIMKPTCITVTILQAMWVWNDYLLPCLVLDQKNTELFLWRFSI